MPLRRAGSFAVVIVLLSSAPALAQRGVVRQCAIATPLKAVPELYESSGLAMSRSVPKRLFSINDSSTPVVFVLGLDGVVRGKIAITGAAVTDWEDVTMGDCPDGSCLYVSDVGDNNAVRRSISMYRMAEPKDGAQQATATRFNAVFPDRPRDAEAVFAGPEGRLYLLTKEARGSGLYAFPALLSADQPNRLERIATLDLGTGRNGFSRITDAETSADGRTVAVRSNDTLFLIPTITLLAGRLSGARVFSLRQLGEPQGEGVALGSDGEVFVAGEGGPKRGVGTFAKLTCAAQ